MQMRFEICLAKMFGFEQIPRLFDVAVEVGQCVEDVENVFGDVQLRLQAGIFLGRKMKLRLGIFHLFFQFFHLEHAVLDLRGGRFKLICMSIAAILVYLPF